MQHNAITTVRTGRPQYKPFKELPDGFVYTDPRGLTLKITIHGIVYAVFPSTPVPVLLANLTEFGEELQGRELISGATFTIVVGAYDA